MCGIHGYVSHSKTLKHGDKIYRSARTIERRGPDRNTRMELQEFVKIVLHFFRLAIIDNTFRGDQPFVFEDDEKTLITMINGEIYDHHKFKNDPKYGIGDKVQSQSDCEVVPHLYMKYGMCETMKLIKESECAGSMIEISKTEDKITLYLFRDPSGVRELYYAYDKDGFAFGSQLSGVCHLVDPSDCEISQMPIGSFLTYTITKGNNGTIETNIEIQQYFDMSFPIVRSPLSDEDLFKKENIEYVFKELRRIFTYCVEKMIESDRPLGALLSGGLDSSAVVAIASKCYRERYGKKMQTFSIGMPGATDKKYAQMVSEHCDTDHTHIELPKEEFLAYLKETQECIATPDITTNRASNGQYIACKIISEQYGIKVLLVGDGSDELMSGYMYFHEAPDADSSHRENVKLMKELTYFDILRADHGVAGNGIECRAPFLLCPFISFIMGLDPRLRVPMQKEPGVGRCMEKWLFRMAFAGTGLLPDEVLFRQKEAFSDGVSSKEDSWYVTIQKQLDTEITDEEFEAEKYSYEHFIPPNKEALYYLRFFCEHFGHHSLRVFPHYWLPNQDWVGEITEPSARVLPAYT
jgi:asparagine synthase (glutamine-hydrolysing)